MFCLGIINDNIYNSPFYLFDIGDFRCDPHCVCALSSSGRSQKRDAKRWICFSRAMGGMGKTVSSRQAGRGSVFDMDRERNFPGRFWNFPQNGTACDGNGCTVCSC